MHLTPNLEASNAMAGFSFALVNVFCGFLRTYPVRGTTRGCRVADSVRTLELQQVRGAALLLVPACWHPTDACIPPFVPRRPWARATSGSTG